MLVKNFEVNKDKFPKTLLLLLNGFLILASILLAFYLIAPFLLGRKLSAYAIISYATWVGIALVSKLHLRRIQKGLRVRGLEYVLLCFFSVVNLVLWFWYPVGIALGAISIIAFFFAYRAHKVHEKKGGKNKDSGKK